MRLFSKQLNNHKGFTLIELLVVIAIIGILATLAIVSLTTARSSSRDAKRIADLKQLQTALEVYYNDNGVYPTLLSDLSSTTLPTKYLETIPTAPTPVDGDCTATSNSYIYNTSYDRSSYSIHTCIGGNTSSLTKGIIVASQNGLSSWKCGENFLDERDGNSYKTIQFGSQCWFGQNLAYLPSVQDATTFVNNGNAQTPAYGVYNYNGSDVAVAKALPIYKLYGVYYNWYAAVATSSTTGSAEGVQGACPTGWHVPTSVEFTTLYDTINNDTKYRCNSTSGAIGKSMASSWGWVLSTTVCAVGNNQQTNNSSGFNGLPVGGRNSGGSFGDVGSVARFWASSFLNPDGVRSYLYYTNNSFYNSTISPLYGLSVRCLKN